MAKFIVLIFIIFMLVFLVAGPKISFLRQYNLLFYREVAILKADSLAAMSMYKDALDIYRSVLQSSPGDSQLKKRLIPKISAMAAGLRRIEEYQTGH